MNPLSLCRVKVLLKVRPTHCDTGAGRSGAHARYVVLRAAWGQSLRAVAVAAWDGGRSPVDVREVLYTMMLHG